ncbi:Cyclin pch1 [Candida viswanathii]|uniref:Cyclin pch1 n=1 Tax=Candida viswanathii TaxID=5486 RepID=A0A367YGX0_9ASCO|nr:Cyclin pch1 [Candida viswanathii]
MTLAPASIQNSDSTDTRDYSLMLPQLRQLTNTWIFTEEAVLEDSPSRQQKVSLAMELRLKESLVDFLIRLGTKLKLDSRSLLAATTYLHRFFMRIPISQSKYYVACAALLISCKLNDSYRQPDSIAKIACNLKAPAGSKAIDADSDIYWKWKDQLLFREELMLRKLNFDLDLVLPYSIREWIFKTYHNPDSFNEKKINVLKMTTSLIEALSVLPLILCYEMNVIFGVCMIITIVEGKRTEGNEDLILPNGLLRDYLDTDYETCMKCFKFIKKILKAGQDDPKCRSNPTLFHRLSKVLSEEFGKIGKTANEEAAPEKNGDDEKKEEDKTSNGETAEKKEEPFKKDEPEFNEKDKEQVALENGQRKDDSKSDESIGDKRKLEDSTEGGPDTKATKTE